MPRASQDEHTREAFAALDRRVAERLASFDELTVLMPIAVVAGRIS